MTSNSLSPQFTASHRWLHRFLVALAVGTVLLIAKGGLVHSAGAGLSVPDWPTTYGENMFTYPVEKWTGGILYEHGHRLIASVIGFLTIIAAVWIWLVDHRRWMKLLAGLSLFAVIIQGLLGGLTVLMRLPTAVSVSHAILAQSFLIMTVTMAAATSKKWITGLSAREVPVSVSWQRFLFATFIVTFVQIFLGALTRHTYSGMAIIDFPLSNGMVIPEFTSLNVAIHFAHRIGALILTIMILVQGIKLLRTRELSRLSTPALLLLVMVLLQATLGAFVIWTREAILPNTLHVAGGAVTFLLSYVVYLYSRRWYKFTDRVERTQLELREAHA